MKIKKERNKGFTLVEMIIYIGVLVIVSVLLVNSILVMLRAFNRGRLISRINTSAETAMERITRETREANGVDTIVGGNPSTLKLDSYDLSKGGDTHINFVIDGAGMLTVQESAVGGGEGTGPISPLLSAGLQATQFFVYSTTTSTSEMISVKLEITGSNGNYQKSETFYGSVILRKSY